MFFKNIIYLMYRSDRSAAVATGVGFLAGRGNPLQTHRFLLNRTKN